MILSIRRWDHIPCYSVTDIVLEPAESDSGARRVLDRGAECREGLRLVSQGQAQEGARHRFGCASMG